MSEEELRQQGFTEEEIASLQEFKADLADQASDEYAHLMYGKYLYEKGIITDQDNPS